MEPAGTILLVLALFAVLVVGIVIYGGDDNG